MRGIYGFVLALTVVGCKQEQETNLPICREEVAGSEAQEVQTGQVPPEVWFSILLRNYDRKSASVARPVKDCSGGEVSVEPVAVESCPGYEGAQPLPERPLQPEDLFVVPTPDGRMLVWIKTTHYENGESVGPIAIAEWSKRGVAIRKIGALRAHGDKAALRLEPMGSEQVLVVESRVCKLDNPDDCARMIKLVPLLGDRFVEQPLILEDGTCLGPPRFEMFKKEEVQLDGLIRTFELARSIDFTDGNVVLSEQVKIEDKNPEEPEAPPKLFRKANVQRPLQATGKGIVTKDGLWAKMLSEHGSVHVTEQKPASE